MPSSTRGSSPLTRGKRRAARGRLGCSRLIPAHAGKTRPTHHRLATPRAHPRSRGENHRRSAPNGIKNGSSPLTRGKPAGDMPFGATQGLIPAHAGKTPTGRQSTGGQGAHPRSRGENPVGARVVDQAAGSSPLTRGKQDIWHLRGAARRLIPAHAGKTKDGVLKSMSIGAHPRSRGENEAGDEKGSTFDGSSPLTRGKPAGSFSPGISRRLIPAHAGKTRGTTVRDRISSAHPRSRGENRGVT